MKRDKDDVAEDARFQAFLEATHQHERDWIAFCQFEEAVGEVTHCAALVNPYDDSDRFEREREGMHAAVWSMMLSIIPRIGLGSAITHPEGLGYGLRYGIIPPKADALDHIANEDAFEDLMQRAYETEELDRKRREDEMAVRMRQLEERAERRKRHRSPSPAKE